MPPGTAVRPAGAQNNFIDRDDLLAAFTAWVADKAAAPGPDPASSAGQLDEDRRALLEALVARAPQAPRRRSREEPGGPQLARLGATDDLERLGDPDLQASLAAGRLASGRIRIGDTEATASFTRPASRRRRARLPHPPVPRRGRAGRGLRRPRRGARPRGGPEGDPARHADDAESRARFLLEAEITGGLEHPGIVPVYGLGTYDDGRPFYAMRFIKGDSLKEAIDALPRGDSPRPDPGRRWSSASCWAGSSTSATRSPTPTAGGCCTAT